MRNARTLSLKRETLNELTIGELADVNGGSHACTTGNVTHGASCENACPTVPINDCVEKITKAIVLPGTLTCR